mgnify:CR=1 FL=1
MSNGSHVFHSKISTDELAGLNKTLFQALCLYLAILVNVPNPDKNISGINLVDTTTSIAAILETGKRYFGCFSVAIIQCF